MIAAMDFLFNEGRVLKSNIYGNNMRPAAHDSVQPFAIFEFPLLTPGIIYPCNKMKKEQTVPQRFYSYLKLNFLYIFERQFCLCIVIANISV